MHFLYDDNKKKRKNSKRLVFINSDTIKLINSRIEEKNIYSGKTQHPLKSYYHIICMYVSVTE